MWDRVLTALSFSVVILAGCLLLGSGLNQLVGPDRAVLPEGLRFYTAVGLLVVSAILLLCTIAITRHPFYEHWIVIAIGAVVAVVYVL